MNKKAKTCSAEFKAKAVKKIGENNGNISVTARELGLPMKTLSNWQKKNSSRQTQRHKQLQL